MAEWYRQSCCSLGTTCRGCCSDHLVCIRSACLDCFRRLEASCIPWGSRWDQLPEKSHAISYPFCPGSSDADSMAVFATDHTSATYSNFHPELQVSATTRSFITETSFHSDCSYPYSFSTDRCCSGGCLVSSSQVCSCRCSKGSCPGLKSIFNAR